MSKLEHLKNNLYKLAADDKERSELDEIFAREIEIPQSGCYDIDEDPDWFCFEDYMTSDTKKKLGLE